MGRWPRAKTSLIPFRVREGICLAGFQSMPMWEQHLLALPNPLSGRLLPNSAKNMGYPRQLGRIGSIFEQGMCFQGQCPGIATQYYFISYSLFFFLKHPARLFSKILMSVGESDPGYHDGFVKQIQLNSIFLYSTAF